MTINSIEEFEYCIKRGVNPLFFNIKIKIDITLRIEIQNKIFGEAYLSKGSIVKANDRYYRYCWDYGPLVCENCGDSFYRKKNIDQAYSSVHISHIISRSNAPEMAHDPRNHNKLCGKCHRKWESVKNYEMLIYTENKYVIKELKKDYILFRI